MVEIINQQPINPRSAKATGPVKDTATKAEPPKEDNFLNFSKLSDQTALKNLEDKKKHKKNFFEKATRFFKEDTAGSMINGFFPFLAVVGGGLGIYQLFGKNKSDSFVSLAMGGAAAAAYTGINFFIIPQGEKARDASNEKVLGHKIDLEKDLILDKETKRKLWIAIKQFYGYESPLQNKVTDSDTSKTLGGNMLILHGPPGTGKTAIANGIANQAGKKLIYVNVNDIESKWLGDSEKNLAAVFERAEKEGAWLFFDEADALLQSRKALSKDHTVKLTNTFIQQYNQFKDRTKIILATNTPDNIDPAIKSRGVTVGIKTPPKEVRQDILLQKLKNLRIKQANIDELKEKHGDELLKLIDEHQFSGRDIESAVLRAMHSAEGRIHEEQLKGTDPEEKILIDDLKSSFTEIKKETEDAKKSSLDISSLFKAAT